MNLQDPVVVDRVRRLSAVAEDIARRPEFGPYEVGVLEDLLVELRQVTRTGEGCVHGVGVGESVVPAR